MFKSAWRTFILKVSDFLFLLFLWSARVCVRRCASVRGFPRVTKTASPFTCQLFPWSRFIAHMLSAWSSCCYRIFRRLGSRFTSFRLFLTPFTDSGLLKQPNDVMIRQRWRPVAGSQVLSISGMRRSGSFLLVSQRSGGFLRCQQAILGVRSHHRASGGYNTR